MEYIIVAVLSFVAGWKISQTWHLFTFRSILEDLKISNSDIKRLAAEKGLELEEAEQDENANLPILEVRVEQQPEGLFAYRKADSLFLDMGKEREALMQNLVHNLTNVRVVVAKEDGADLINP
jgi:hypothetical protein